MPNHLQTLSLTLSHRIRPHEIPRWRGAFLEMVGWEEELFHNHNNREVKGQKVFSTTTLSKAKNHHRYPLMASASDDGTVHIFHSKVYSDLMRNPLIVPVKILKGHGIRNKYGVLNVSFHPTQPWIFTAGADGCIFLYQDI